MANLNGSASFKGFIRKLETTDPKHPDTWNPNYQQLINNDVYLKQFADEVTAARGDETSLANRVADIEQTQQTLSPQFQNHLVANTKFAIDQANVANYGVRALREQIQQEGEITLTNRGVVTGCTVSKSSTAARNLNLAAGTCFANGRCYAVASGENAASVPSNIGSGAATVYAYLHAGADGLWHLAVTAIGQPVPDGAIAITMLAIPANSTDATDPNLANVVITDVRRMEPQFPALFDNPTTIPVSINRLAGNDYTLAFDVVSATGAPCAAHHVVVASRANNGFTLFLASSADNVTVRWRVSRLHD